MPRIVSSRAGDSNGFHLGIQLKELDGWISQTSLLYSHMPTTSFAVPLATSPRHPSDSFSLCYPHHGDTEQISYRFTVIREEPRESPCSTRRHSSHSAKAVAGISPFGSFSLALRFPSLPFYFSSLAQYIPSTVGGHHIPLACLRSPRAYIASDTCHLQLTTLRPIPWNLSAMENLAASSLDQPGMGASPYHPQ
jgi:hypothetical protein